ncbi:MAG TPA: WhiB family transcriptional regulator [Streptosporangiaceae bacterium]|nr:WhiB family transcriptional regulator [Streptosporangiaceae bacterium]
MTILSRAAPHPERLPAQALLPDQASWAGLVRYGRCAHVSLDPDLWFPVSAKPDTARQEAAAAIAVCAGCLVREQCLRLSLTHSEVGRHGVWGGLLPAEHAALRRRFTPN